MGVDERVAALRARDDGVPAREARRVGFAVRRAWAGSSARRAPMPASAGSRSCRQIFRGLSPAGPPLETDRGDDAEEWE